jgi:hypothetical protein
MTGAILSDDGQTRFVELSASYAGSWSPSFTQTLVALTEQQAVFFKAATGERVEQLILSTQEVDAFLEVLAAYRRARQARRVLAEAEECEDLEPFAF